MCRLYGFRATHPTRIDCELTEAQNSLMTQSRRDERGLESPAGWGLGAVHDGDLEWEREVEPAYESAEYRRDVADVRACVGIAHVRRATVGEPREENCHPFRREGSLFAHNGHVPGFEGVRPRILEDISPPLTRGIRGDTDSEHIFHLLLSRLRRRLSPPPDEIVRDADPRVLCELLAGVIRDIREWRAETGSDTETGGPGSPAGPPARLGLNVLWIVGDRLVGSRVGRSLWYVERDGAHECPVCGNRHPAPEPDEYRSVLVASERITDEAWREVPEPSVFWIDEATRLRAVPLGA